MTFREEEEEEMIWFWGKQDERLYEFGGILTSGKTSQEGSFLHKTIQLEALEYLKEAEFTVIKIRKPFFIQKKKKKSRVTFHSGFFVLRNLLF